MHFEHEDGSHPAINLGGGGVDKLGLWAASARTELGHPDTANEDVYHLSKLGGGVFAGGFAARKHPIFPHLLKGYCMTQNQRR